jgi:heme exporter protein D
MASFVALAIGLSLVLVLAVTVLFLMRRKRRPSTAADRYQRDMQKIQLETYLRSKPGHTRQPGNPDGSQWTVF